MIFFIFFIQLTIISFHWVPIDVPEISRSQSVKAEEGKNATLSCNAIGNPVPTISWTKDGSVITRSSRINFSADKRQLTVTNMSRADSGEYLCVAKNSLGSDTSSGIKLDVQCKQSTTIYQSLLTGC